MKIESSAASNIALIKYMGKIPGTGNRPTNASISFTLDHLRTFVRLTPILELSSDDKENQKMSSADLNQNIDLWRSLKRSDLYPIQLSEKGQKRFLQHFEFLKKQWNISENYLIESANNFPSDCGLASSASSFAALTVAASELFQKINPIDEGKDLQWVSSLSRQGSGSSCRSLYTPWAIWKEEYAEPVVGFKNEKLIHSAIIVEDSIKAVSSSEAHRLVTNSPRFEGRIERAQLRLNDLIQALREGDWSMAYQICWDEFIDMHRLFETSTPAFSYMTDGSHEVLKYLKSHWENKMDGPIVTMDAGANVHLLFRENQFELCAKMNHELGQKFRVLSSLREKYDA